MEEEEVEEEEVEEEEVVIALEVRSQLVYHH